MNNFKAILTTLAALTTSTAAVAGEKPSASNLPQEVAQMHCLVGDWEGPINASMGGKTMKLQATLSCKATSDGHAISCKSKFAGGPMGTHYETDLFGFDAHTQTYHWYAVTNSGEVHDHVAPIPKSDTVSFVYRGQMEGKPYVERIDLRFNKKAKSITFRNKTTHAGKKLFGMVGTVRKR